MIESSRTRAQISQLEQYQTAINAFKLKYNALPGDIPDPAASSFGFVARASAQVPPNGDGVIGGYYSGGVARGYSQPGEPALFWRDLADNKLINFTSVATSGFFINATAEITATTTPSISQLFPAAASGNGGYLYVWSGGHALRWNNADHDNKNYMSISAVTQINDDGTQHIDSNPNLSAASAFSIDTKIDDGLPQLGRLRAFYLDESIVSTAAMGWTTVPWASGGEVTGTSCGAGCTPRNGPTTAAVAASSTVCYHNNNTAGQNQQYNLQFSNELNCALTLQF